MRHEKSNSVKTLEEVKKQEQHVGRLKQVGRVIMGAVGGVVAFASLGQGATEAKVTPDRPPAAVAAAAPAERSVAQPVALSLEAASVERQKIPVDAAEVQRRVAGLADKIEILYSTPDEDNTALSIPGENGSVMRQVVVNGPDGVKRIFSATFPSAEASSSEATGITAKSATVEGDVRAYEMYQEPGTGVWYGSFNSTTGEQGGFDNAAGFTTATANIDLMIERAEGNRPVEG